MGRKPGVKNKTPEEKEAEKNKALEEKKLKAANK